MESKEENASIATIHVEECLPSPSSREAGLEFSDLDDRANLTGFLDTINRRSTRNFVLDFSDHAARVVFDLNATSLATLLGSERPESLSTRWLNIWHPFEHREILQLLATRYDFSPRLFALMCSNPRQRTNGKPLDSTGRSLRRTFWRRSRPRSNDCEAGKEVDELSEHSSIASTDSVAGGNIYKIVDNLWHYSSVDFGRSYVCVGYNSLYGTRNSGDGEGSGPLPQCIRVWTWLLLCEGGTVITINEDPFADVSGTLKPLQQRILCETRRNLVNVFRSLSAIDEDNILAQNPLTVLPIRTRLGDTLEESAHRDSDAPGLLFYYLFENWHNSYTLITRKESRYGIELGKVREEMFHKPQLHHIDRLDRLGKELGVLRRHYASYEKIIDRLVEPQTQTVASLQNSHIAGASSRASVDTVRLVTEKESMLGVSLSSAARARFKRLRDVIDLYALSEVDEYLKQKDSLVAMNFNLIAIKQSTDVERLTRITLLITKATMLFLPVSLMTAYFSVDLVNVDYTQADYWISFAVIFSLSWGAMFVFGVFSGSVETMAVMRGIAEGLQRARDSIPRHISS